MVGSFRTDAATAVNNNRRSAQRYCWSLRGGGETWRWDSHDSLGVRPQAIAFLFYHTYFEAHVAVEVKILSATTTTHALYTARIAQAEPTSNTTMASIVRVDVTFIESALDSGRAAMAEFVRMTKQTCLCHTP